MTEFVIDLPRLLKAPKLYRLENLYKIRTKNQKLENLKLNNIQRRIYEDLYGRYNSGTPIRDYYLKYRQGGVSTFFLIFWLDETIFNENTISACLSYERESLKYLWDIIRVAYDNMPKELKLPYGKYNETELTFPDKNSKIFVSLSIRSTAVHNLHISEICHMDASDIKASLAAVSPKGNITIESTANGLGNEGHVMYQEARTELNGYKSHFFPWFIQDEYKTELNGVIVKPTEEETKLTESVKRNYQLELKPEQILWRRVTKKQQGYLYDQEFPEDEEKAFLSTGNPHFDNKKMLALLTEARELNKKEPAIEETYEYTLWENPSKQDVYVAGVDTAEGIDGDWSVMKVLNVTQRREAFRYRAKVSVDKLYKECDKWGREFNNCLLAVERNNHGHAVLLGLYETMRYPNLYVQDADTRIVRVRGIQEKKKIVKIGWETTALSKPLMLDQLKQALEGNPEDDVDTFQPEFTVKDDLFLQETLTMQQNGHSINAILGKHDDIVMASAIAFQMYLRARKRIGAKLNAGILIGDEFESIKKFGII